MSLIAQVRSREVLDSRGNPTVEVEITLSDGACGRASVPSGASTGANEAVEIRDGDPDRFLGRGVLKAIKNISQEIAPQIIGRSALDQEALDGILVELDATHDKSRLGANAILGTSLAVAQAASISQGKSLYYHLGNGNKDSFILPVPMLNIINGGRHAEDSTDVQEFMIVPAGFDSFQQALRAGVEVYHSLKELLRARGLSISVGDEGGFAPSLSSNEDALELLLSAIQKAGYKPGLQCFIALDVAASELLVEGGAYSLAREQVVLSPEQLIQRYERWVREYPIISIEDGMDEEDWDSWRVMTDRLGDRVQIVGDDLFTTDTKRIQKGIEVGCGNAVLIKINQIGTVTETLEAMSLSKAAGWGTVVSHRSGETEDTTIADLAVATGAGQIKSGAPARGERTAKYNRLIRIEEELGEKAEFAGSEVYQAFIYRR